MTCWGVKVVGESDSAGNCKFPKPKRCASKPHAHLCGQKKTAESVRNLNSDTVNDFCRHVRAEALVNIAQFSKLAPFTPSHTYVGIKNDLLGSKSCWRERFCRKL